MSIYYELSTEYWEKKKGEWNIDPILKEIEV